MAKKQCSNNDLSVRVQHLEDRADKIDEKLDSVSKCVDVIDKTTSVLVEKLSFKDEMKSGLIYILIAACSSMLAYLIYGR